MTEPLKTIIISDVSNHAENIIPYGLNFGKFTASDVEILHIIDPRIHQGVSSRQADSQSITPANKMSHHEILQREKQKADVALDRLLSKEASRLNYPLKIKVNISTDYLEKSLKEQLREAPGSIIIVSKKPENTMISSIFELMSVVSGLNVALLIAGPGQRFHKPMETLLLTDFSEEGYDRIKEIFKWLKPFDPLVHATAIIQMDQFIEMELKGKAWKQVVKHYLSPSTLLKTSLIKGEDRMGSLLDYTQRNHPDMLILPKENKGNAHSQAFTGEEKMQLADSLNIPMLIY
jgi:hypothetical protein